MEKIKIVNLKQSLVKRRDRNENDIYIDETTYQITNLVNKQSCDRAFILLMPVAYVGKSETNYKYIIDVYTRQQNRTYFYTLEDAEKYINRWLKVRKQQRKSQDQKSEIFYITTELNLPKMEKLKI